MKIYKLLASALLMSVTSLLASGEVNLYSHRHYDTDRELYKTFEAQTGIKVNVVHAKAAELLARLKIKGANSPADLFITADVGNLYDAKSAGLLQSIESDTLNKIILQHCEMNCGKW